MKSLKIASYAKLNLYLEVLKKLPDKYHSIFTLFERISLSDDIHLKVLPEKEIRIVLANSNSDSLRGKNNLAYKAAKLLQEEFDVRYGVEIYLKKNIPVAAGLGGGSSNAASVLKGLNHLWGLNVSLKRLVEIASKIGSDVPFFLYDYPFAFGSFKGDVIKNAGFSVKFWHIIVVPKVKVFSSVVYQKWDEYALKKEKINKNNRNYRQVNNKSVVLTSSQMVVKILQSVLLEKDFSRINEVLFNSLESVTEGMHPVIRKIKRVLSNLGVRVVLMSGSGPSVYGLVSSRKEAYAVAGQLSKFGAWAVFVAKTV